MSDRSRHRPPAIIRTAASWALLAASALVAGCAASEPPAGPSGGAEANPVTPSADGYAVEPWFDGMVEVAAGRQLDATCYATGSPAVINLHGMIQLADSVSWAHSPQMQRRLGAETTYCEYERTNVGNSSKRAGPIPVSETVADLHALIQELELPTPVVLLGGSFGGLVAYTYAGTHPGDVAGVVLLDPTLPDELALDHAFLTEDLWLTEDAWQSTTEKIDSFGAFDIAQAALDGIPSVPGTIFVTEHLWAPPGEHAEPFRQAVRDQQQALIERFDPPKTITVDAPHAMMSVVPDDIAAAVLEIVADSR